MEWSLEETKCKEGRFVVALALDETRLWQNIKIDRYEEVVGPVKLEIGRLVWRSTNLNPSAASLSPPTTLGNPPEQYLQSELRWEDELRRWYLPRAILASNKAMVRYLTMKLWQRRLGWAHYYLSIVQVIALSCLLGEIFSVQLVLQCMDVEKWVGGETSSSPFFLEPTLLLSSHKLLLFSALTLYLSTLLLISRAPHTRHQAISLQEHLHKPHVVNATHLERPNLYLMEIR